MRYPKSQKSVLLKHGVRSGLELENKGHLESLGVPFSYEGHKIKWEDSRVRTYKPDFVLVSNGIIVETKGRFLASDRRKHLEVKKQYPMLDIRFVFSNPNNKINKGSKTRYCDWCDKKGFMWAAKVIPQSWIDEPEVALRIEDI